MRRCVRSHVVLWGALACAAGALACALPAFAGAPAHRIKSPDSIAHHTPAAVTPTLRSIPERPRQAGSAAATISVTGRYTHLSPFSPGGGVPVEWWVPVAGAWEHGSTTTDANGVYTLSGLPPATENGELWIGSLGRTALSWSESSPATYDFNGSGAQAVVARGGPWADWEKATLRLWGDDGTSTVVTSGSVSNPGATPRAVSISALPGLYSDATINYWANEGAEYHGLFRNQLSNWLTATDVDFTDADHGWATTSFQGTVMRTTDGGRSWAELTPFPTFSAQFFFHRLDFSDAQHGLVLNGGWTGENYVYRTADGGYAWSRVDLNGFFNDVACGDATHAWAVGQGGAIIASADGGATWSAQQSGTTADLVCVAFSDALHGWAAGSAGTVLRTVDGGATWTPQDSGSTHDLDFLCVPDADHAYLVSGAAWNDPAPETVLHTVDAGATWSATAAQPGGDWIDELEFADATHGWAAGDKVIWRTADGGVSWQSSSLDFTVYDGSRPLGAASVTHLWVGSGGELRESTDGGVTWLPNAAAFDQSRAQRITVGAPVYASGAPGTRAKLRFNGFPVGWVADLTGYASWPATSPERDFGTLTSTGTATQTRTFTVPRNAPPGYFYVFHADHQQGPLQLDVAFEVCSLRSSSAAIRAGGTIKLSGVVPVAGHQGAARGIYKYVAIFGRTTPAGQPAVPDPRKKGWSLVKVVRSDRLGAYHTPLLKPKKTTWYVAMFGSDDWYWGGYTSVVKVTVR